jgi:hypothetical protein
MSPGAPLRTTLPLWPLPFLAALLPFVVSHLAWWLSVREGLIPACNPYWDGCVSISRAARYGLGNHLFRLVMLPCATVQVLCWLVATHWLRRETPAKVRVLPWIGLAAGLFLGLYATFLGSDGDIYQALRRYGVYLYFGCSYIALMLVLHALSTVQPRPRGYAPLLTVAFGFLSLGVLAVALAYALVNSPSGDRWENVLEWHVGLWLTAMFAAMAWCWWRQRLRVALLD